jgi:hypothetical protein
VTTTHSIMSFIQNSLSLRIIYTTQEDSIKDTSIDNGTNQHIMVVHPNKAIMALIILEVYFPASEKDTNVSVPRWS